MLILREVEKTFYSAPAAEQGANNARTEEGKVKHLEQMFLVRCPPNEGRGLGEKNSKRQRAVKVLRQKGVFLGPGHRERPSHKHRVGWKSRVVGSAWLWRCPSPGSDQDQIEIKGGGSQGGTDALWVGHRSGETCCAFVWRTR